MLLDTVGFWVVVIYAVALRNYLPSAMLEQGDLLIQQQLVMPILANFLVGRIITFYVAKLFSDTSQYPWVRKTALATVMGSALLGVIGLGVYQYQAYAAAEAARLEAEANAVTVDKLKGQVSLVTDEAAMAISAAAESTSKATTQAVDDAAKALGQASTAASATADKVAADAKQKLYEACKSTAEALGKSPDDYCK